MIPEKFKVLKTTGSSKINSMMSSFTSIIKVTKTGAVVSGVTFIACLAMLLGMGTSLFIVVSDTKLSLITMYVSAVVVAKLTTLSSFRSASSNSSSTILSPSIASVVPPLN